MPEIPFGDVPGLQEGDREEDGNRWEVKQEATGKLSIKRGKFTEIYI